MQDDPTDSLPDFNLSSTLKQFTDINYLKQQLLNYLLYYSQL